MTQPRYQSREFEPNYVGLMFGVWDCVSEREVPLSRREIASRAETLADQYNDEGEGDDG